MGQAVDILKEVLTSADASTTEKINAAKALDAIERRAGANDRGTLANMTLEEIDEEIAAVRAEIGRLAAQSAPKPAPKPRGAPRKPRKRVLKPRP